MRSLYVRLTAPGVLSARPEGWALTLTRFVSGVIFILFGAGKFLNHASELTSFKGYGLPWPNVCVDVIGALEIAGGILLILGLATRLSALLLAADMAGAIVVSGIAHGETISLTLAPALLAASIALVLLGPGRIALDARLDVTAGPRAPRRRSTEGM